MTIPKRYRLGVCTANYCLDYPWRCELRVKTMANCNAFLGDLTPGYLCQHGALPEVASRGRHCNIYPRLGLFCFRYRALVCIFGPTPTNAQNIIQSR